MSLEIALQVGVNIKCSCIEKACMLEELLRAQSDCWPRRQAGQCFTWSRFALYISNHFPRGEKHHHPYSEGRGTVMAVGQLSS